MPYYRVRIDTYQSSKFARDVLKRLVFNGFMAHIIFVMDMEHPKFGPLELSVEYIFKTWLSGGQLTKRINDLLGDLGVTVIISDLIDDRMPKSIADYFN